jgi:hypothetical protein
MTAEGYISVMETINRSLTDPIITKICRRAVRTMKSWDCTLVDSSEDWPECLNFFDVLSILMQDHCTDEVNPALDDTIENTLRCEFNRLTPLEKQAVFCSEVTIDYDTDHEECRRKIMSCFWQMLNDHYRSRKVQSYLKNVT